MVPILSVQGERRVLKKCLGLIDVGCNYYIQRKEPRMVPEYDMVHVGKLSCGWRAHFDGSSAVDDAWEPLDEHVPRIGSMDDLRGYLGTGEWELVDEHGRKATIDEMLSHDEVVRDGKLVNTRVSPSDYLDREGYPWSRFEFS